LHFVVFLSSAVHEALGIFNCLHNNPAIQKVVVRQTDIRGDRPIEQLALHVRLNFQEGRLDVCGSVQAQASRDVQVDVHVTLAGNYFVVEVVLRVNVNQQCDRLADLCW
jgi:hypothetical protein